MSILPDVNYSFTKLKKKKKKSEIYQKSTCLPTKPNPPIVGKVLSLFGEGAGKVGSKQVRSQQLLPF